jgi:hypothetical protein
MPNMLARVNPTSEFFPIVMVSSNSTSKIRNSSRGRDRIIVVAPASFRRRQLQRPAMPGEGQLRVNALGSPAAQIGKHHDDYLRIGVPGH